MPENKYLMILHGYHLDGSGSCVYVQSVAHEFAKSGNNILLLCQEPEPEKYDFISEAYELTETGKFKELFKRDSQKTAGKVIYVRPFLKDKLLPVFVSGKFPGFDNVKAFTELSDSEIQSYVDTNVDSVLACAEKYPVETVFANHIVMTPYIAAVARDKNPKLDYFLIPHGSEIEYLIKKDKKYFDMAVKSLSDAKGIISGSQEMIDRISGLFKEFDQWKNKISLITIGVDSTQFSAPLSQSRKERVQGLRNEIQKQLDASTSSIDNADPAFLKDLDKIDFDNNKTIVNFGKLIPGKGVQDLLFAAPLLMKEIPNLHIVIAGDGKYKDFFKEMIALLQEGNESAFKAMLEKESAESDDTFDDPFQFINGYLEKNGSNYFKTAKSVKWAEKIAFTGYIKHPSLKYLLCLADVAVFPSIIKEAYPLALLEAMAAGAFPVASYWGGLKDGLYQLDGLFGEDILKTTRVDMTAENRMESMIGNTLSALQNIQSDTREKMVKHINKNCSWKKVCKLTNEFFIA